MKYEDIVPSNPKEAFQDAVEAMFHRCHHLMAKLERLKAEHKIEFMPKIEAPSGFGYDLNFKWFEESMILKFAQNLDEETKAYTIRLIKQMMEAEKKYTIANQKLANYDRPKR